MAKYKSKRRKKTAKKKNMAFLFFTLFTIIAILIVLLLEYIDYNKGKDSFIFDKILSMPQKSAASKKINSPQVVGFDSQLKRLLEKEKIRYEYFKDEQDKTHFKFTLSYHQYEAIISEMKKISQQVRAELHLSEMQRVNDKSLMLFSLQKGNFVTHIILVTRLEKKLNRTQESKRKENGNNTQPAATPVTEKRQVTPNKQERKKSDPGKIRVAFIIDDVGEYAIGALELKQLGIPITASILPDSPQAHQEANWIEEYHLEAMIHVPMQPRSNSNYRYHTAKTVTMESSDAEMRNLIQRAKKIVPQARGVNNHMGSLVTADPGVMERFLVILKSEGLFFIDSKTIGSTVGYDIAKSLGIKTAIRDVFLDDGPKSYEKAVGKIKELVYIAMRKGSAIAIGHPHPTTIRAIQDSVRFIKAKGVEIVFVSELLH